MKMKTVPSGIDTAKRASTVTSPYIPNTAASETAVEAIKNAARAAGGKCQDKNCRHCRKWVGNNRTDPKNHRWQAITTRKPIHAA